MRRLQVPSLALSLLLQWMPLLRVASADAALALSPVMAVLRLIAGATAVAGSYHAVSGATGPSINSTKTKVGAIGINLNYRITLSGGTPESFVADPLPAGLELSLVKDSNSGDVIGARIDGFPTDPGETVSHITAWDNENFTGQETSADVTFLIVDVAPLSPSVPAGNPVTFTVLGPQTVTATYRWLHNDVEIAGATDSSFTVPAVAEADAGQYHARVAFGSTFVFTQKTTLTVAPPANPPTFTETPADASLHLGEPLVLRAAATGEGELTFAWTKNGEPLPVGNVARFELATVALEDAGSYRVMVTGSGGSTNSLPATVTVAAPLAIGAVSADAGNLLVPFNGILGRTYLLEHQTTPGSPEWQQTAELAITEASTFQVPVPESDFRLFRVRTN